MCVLVTLFVSWLFVTPWTIIRQSPQSMEFSRQEYWSSGMGREDGEGFRMVGHKYTQG